MKKNYFEEIENAMSNNLANRGMDKVKLDNQLINAVTALNQCERIVIATGFAVGSCKTGETDGPPGALALAYTLEKLNKKTIIVTDKYSDRFIKAGVEMLHLKSDICVFEEGREEEQTKEIFEKYNPDHIIGIERPGRSFDGKCYSMRGEDITELCPNTDLLFIKAVERKVKTSAVGDGGNEVGMGKIIDFVKKYVDNGEKICAKTAVDNLIVAGVSNWGAFGLCAGLSVVNDKMMMYDENLYTQIIHAIVKEGAVDGCSRKREITVDGLSNEENLHIFNTMRNIVERKLTA